MVRQLAEGTEGWLPSDAGAFLYELVKNSSGRGAVVEAGSWLGRTTIWLAAGSMAGPNVPVYAIDPHAGSREHERLGKLSTYEQFLANIERAGISDVVHPVLGTAAEAARVVDGPVEVFFTDWPYDYEQAYEDLTIWFPRLVPGGWFVMNNTLDYPGPMRLARELLRSRRVTSPVFIRGIMAVQKGRPSRRRDRIYNRYVLALRDAYRIGSQVDLPGPARSAGRFVARKLQ